MFLHLKNQYLMYIFVTIKMETTLDQECKIIKRIRVKASLALAHVICHLAYAAKLKAQTPLWFAYYVLAIAYDMT